MTTKLEQSMLLNISVATLKYLWLLETFRYSRIVLKTEMEKVYSKKCARD